MYLQRLEIIGFKSFADKTVLDFLAPSANSRGITGIVGPNGSGKSNIADAIRWVLGEQSTKLLRGKRADDVIFSGSQKRARAGFAEVLLYLNNEDGALPLDFTEVTIGRRIYRNGDSEYLINKSKVRLADLQLLLAQARFGARTYAVIGQGMVDNILSSSPQERKEFFDEAAGVKEFQIKRHQSLNKIANAKENLQQAEMLITEIEPRLRSLSRQVHRLEERGTLKEDIHAFQHQYYGSIWHDLTRKLNERKDAVGKIETEWKKRESILEEAKSELASLEKQETGDDVYSKLHEKYEELLEDKNRLRTKELQIKSEIEIAQEVKKRIVVPIPLTKIIERVSSIGESQGKAVKRLKAARSLDGARATIDDFEVIHASATVLADELERPATETATPIKKDPAMLKELDGIATSMKELAGKIRTAQDALRNYSAGEQKKKEKFFSLQHQLQDRISAAHALERELGDERVEFAKLDTRREALEQEMTHELGEKMRHAKETFNSEAEVDTDVLSSKIERLKYKLQLIGGIDPEVVREYEETKDRYDYLYGQVTDLAKAIEDLEKVIAELDITIKARSEASFRQLNRDFDRFFKTLFSGGEATLVQVMGEDEKHEGDENVGSEEKPRRRSDIVIGIDIQAIPPGKKIKHIGMLSGGERALTSIALICAILTNNPSPFVVLDEVDAALDESNAERFAAIVQELAKDTQFIVITHNRYTMRKANVLYGVTMHDNGTSQLISVNLDETDKLKNEKGQKATA